MHCATTCGRGFATLQARRDLSEGFEVPETNIAPPDTCGWGDVLGGVADGTRTRDSQDHNLVLYQLNYSHHCRAERRERS